MKHSIRALAHGTFWPKALLAVLLALGLSMRIAATVVFLVVIPFMVRIFVRGQREEFHEDIVTKRARMLADPSYPRSNHD